MPNASYYQAEPVTSEDVLTIWRNHLRETLRPHGVDDGSINVACSVKRPPLQVISGNRVSYVLAMGNRVAQAEEQIQYGLDEDGEITSHTHIFFEYNLYVAAYMDAARDEKGMDEHVVMNKSASLAKAETNVLKAMVNAEPSVNTIGPDKQFQPNNLRVIEVSPYEVVEVTGENSLPIGMVTMVFRGSYVQKLPNYYKDV